MGRTGTKTARDFIDHDGPIARADGVRPYNSHLWPTEDWWANRELNRSYSSLFRFGYVALSDGRFSTDGFTFSITRGHDCYGRPCVFETREQAIRVSAARMIRLARSTRHAKNGYEWDRCRGERLAALVNWALAIVARESGKPGPPLVHVPASSPEHDDAEPRVEKGLPLFEYGKTCESATDGGR